MAAELWRLDNENWTLYIDSKHDREIKNIKRSRDWQITATYQKNEKIIGLQWRIPNADYRKAKRIEKRVNYSVHKTEESA
ncbi:hypothetical protein H9636_18425 [Ureibacillus sp. Re31]|uniref:Uncharacterized protein n=1 Tax=Ureibacillus galli TaxID=2762222 RepID=A0ABR8XHA6_9BACL|nr:hypothetical protein [Ureibacillus galli]MBD8028614.1 hypothetical protein [Ureibacillus galli]